MRPTCVRISLFIVFIFVQSHIVFAQNLTQTVKGQVIEKETKFPLTGATVLLVTDTTHLTGAMTDAEGNFKLEHIKVGRQRLRVTFIGFQEYTTQFEVGSAKEVMLTIPLEPVAATLQEVAIHVQNDGESSNDMASSSARSFNTEETQRYPGSRGDPARMASNFAGVQGADDSRNDIVIRGNSPQAVLWRMEGINIPNPNHFNIPGTAGGPVSMINNKILANSDFYSGAFPAEFGNSLSGVFDLKLRKGNNEKHEVSAQLGFLGTELFAEGPLSSQKKSSYLFSYRYSTLSLFNKLGIDIGTNSIPKYQDIAFKFNFPFKNKSSLSLFGIGGQSNIDVMISKLKQPDRNIYGDNDRDQHFGSAAGVIGASYKYPISSDKFFATTLALSGEMVKDHDDLVYHHLNASQHYVLDSLQKMMGYRFQQNKVSLYVTYSQKLKKAGTLNLGITGDAFFFRFLDSLRNLNASDPAYLSWRLRWKSNAQSILLQPYLQWKYDFSDRTSLLIGLHSQYFSMTKSFIAAEPRLGLKWRLNERNRLSFAVGMHSQIQPPYLYFYGQTNDAAGNPISQNQHLGFTRSIHYVISHDWSLGENLRLKSEIYYQTLFSVPVESTSSSFSMVNTGAGFARFFPGKLVNNGIGKNYGVEMTVEKFFSHGYLFLLTGSLFDSKYRGSDKQWRNTDFNGNYIFNALFSKEWFVKERNTILIGGKITTSGGRRYGPVDTTQSRIQRDVVYVDGSRNSLQFRPYFRADLRVSYKVNRPKVTHEIAIDFVNIFGNKNILKLTYSPNDLDHSANPVREEYQLGFLPLFYYRIDFKGFGSAKHQKS